MEPDATGRPLPGAVDELATDHDAAVWPDPPGAREALARLHRFGGDALVRDMAGVFLADMPGRVALAKAALSAGDAGRVAYATHTMKSSSAQFGAEALQRLCAEAERLARAGDVAPVGALLRSIERELAAYSAWLRYAVPAGGARS